MAIKTYDYEGTPISFHFEGNTKLINLSQMAKKFKKQVNPFFRSKQTATYVDTLHKHLNISRSDNSRIESIRSFNAENLAKTYPELIKVIKGGEPQLQGTWAHEKIALKFAAWLSPAFELWVYDRIFELLTTGTTQLLYTKKEIEWYLTKIMDNAQDTQNLIDSFPIKGLDVNRKK